MIFRITLYEADDPNEIIISQQNVENDGSEVSATFNNLKPNTEYNVEIVSIANGVLGEPLMLHNITGSVIVVSFSIL